MLVGLLERKKEKRKEKGHYLKTRMLFCANLEGSLSSLYIYQITKWSKNFVERNVAHMSYSLQISINLTNFSITVCQLIRLFNIDDG